MARAKLEGGFLWPATGSPSSAGAAHGKLPLVFWANAITRLRGVQPFRATGERNGHRNSSRGGQKTHPSNNGLGGRPAIVGHQLLQWLRNYCAGLASVFGAGAAAFACQKDGSAFTHASET